jgi:hypothetical protein
MQELFRPNPATQETNPIPQEMAGISGGSALLNATLSDNPSPTPPLRPILGANTFYRSEPREPHILERARIVAQTPPATPVKSNPFSVSSVPSGTQPVNGFTTKLSDQYRHWSDKGGRNDSEDVAHRFAENFASEIQNYMDEQGHGALPNNYRWKILRDLIDTKAFAMALVFGAVSPRQAAVMDVAELRTRASEFLEAASIPNGIRPLQIGDLAGGGDLELLTYEVVDRSRLQAAQLRRQDPNV